MVTDFKTTGKDNDLFDTLLTYFGKTINLARIKFLSKMLKAIVILRTVNFAKLATAFGGKADALSSMRRIQRFMADYDLDLSIVARLIFKLLPHKGPYTLSMDRTNWQFGSFDINALVLAVTYQGVAFPLLFRLLPKKGNSNTQERIDLMERYIALFGKSSIDCLVADREFVGGHWIGWLNDNRIRYHIRIRENFWVHNPRNGKDFKAAVQVQGTHTAAVDEGIHRLGVIVAAHVIHTLEHHAESDTLVVTAQREGVCVLRHVRVAKVCSVVIVDEAIVIHILILQVTHLQLVGVSGLRQVRISQVSGGDEALGNQTVGEADGAALLLLVCGLQHWLVDRDNLVLGMSERSVNGIVEVLAYPVAVMQLYLYTRVLRLTQVAGSHIHTQPLRHRLICAEDVLTALIEVVEHT